MVAKNIDELRITAEHCLTHNSIMRYIDVGEAARLIIMIKKQKELLLNDSGLNSKFLEFDNVFPNIKSVSLNSIKTYYCQLLKFIKPEGLQMIQIACKNKMKPRYLSSSCLTTNDAHTITDGPALYLTNRVEDIANQFLNEANISKSQMNEIMTSIQQNNQINQKVDILQKQLEDKLKLNDCKEKKSDISSRVLDADSRAMLRNIDNLQSMVRVVSLDDSYIPNKLKHIRKYVDDMDGTGVKGKPFCSDIPEGVVEEIMLINGIEDNWKILLMMGIGVFASGLTPEYMEIMKDLADTQQLYLIIASTDYIYGTNYQFCHGYIGDDLTELTQEKCIQALGRIGRNKLQYNYSVRFKNNELLNKLFFDDPHKPEAVNINKLFLFE